MCTACLANASRVVSARASAVEAADESGSEKPEALMTLTMQTLESVTQMRTLADGAAASKMLHNDSSERLLQLS